MDQAGEKHVPGVKSHHEGASRAGIWREGRVEMVGSPDWPEGTTLRIIPEFPPQASPPQGQFVVIAGFGLAGRYVAELLEERGIAYSLIDRNPETLQTQASLGRWVVQGDAASAETLDAAGMRHATHFAITIPDEDSMTRAAACARRIRPEVYILARAAHVSRSLAAMRNGANEVITAEQEIALRFHDRFAAMLSSAPASADVQPTA